MKTGDERKARIAELRKLKRDDFSMRDKLDFAEIDIEEWSDVMSEIGEELDKPNNISRTRRVAVTAAYKSGWYDKAPEGLADEDFKLMPPGLVAGLGNEVLLLFNEIVAPDASFT